MLNLQLSQKQIEKAKEAKSPKELLDLATEHGIPLTMEQAEEGYAKLHPDVLQIADEELDNVSGGGCFSSSGCPNCGSNDLEFKGMSMQYDVIYCRNCHNTFYS